jgi:hypothetical protein
MGKTEGGGMTEAEMQRLAERYLKAHALKYFHIKNNAGQQRHRASSHKHLKGWPDLTIFFPGGKVLLVELKTPEGRLTAEQKEHLKLFSALGFSTCVCTDIADFYETVRHYSARCRGAI